MKIDEGHSIADSFAYKSGILPLCLVALVASAIVAPMCFLGNASGHDFQPHIASWIEVSNQWREGIIFPRWAAGANYNFGEPRFIFYPPLSWMIGAALGSVLPWKIVPGVVIWLCIVTAGGAMWRLSRELFAPKQAVAAALFFAANPYHIALVYYRSAFAELLASALFPLVVASALAVLRAHWSRLLLLAVSFGLIWLANAPAAVITTYSLAILLLVACCLARSVRPLLLGGVSALAGFGLAAFYILPAWWEQRWIQIANTASTTYDPTHNFLFTKANEADFVQFNWKISAVAVVIIVLTVALVALNRYMRAGRREVWWMAVALSLVAILLMLPLSGIAWRYIPELRFLQFPWRWLLVLGFAFAFLAGGATRRQTLIWFTLGIIIAATSLTIAGDTSWDSEDVQEVVESVRAQRGYEGIEGFQPRTAKVGDLDDESPIVGEVDPESGDIDTPENVKIEMKQWATETKAFETSSENASKLALRLLDYPAWEVSVDGQRVRAESAPQTGQIILPVEAGTHRVELHFRGTRDRSIGAAISIISLVGLFVPLLFATNRLRPPVRN